MMTARFFSGASLFALLIVDICCLPLKKGSNPSASYSSSYTNVAPNVGYNQGAPSSHFSPGVVRPNNAPPHGVSPPSYQLMPEPTFSQPAVQRGPAASVGSSSLSGPVQSGYSGSSVRQNYASSAQPGAAFQPGPQEINWAVAPPSLSSGGRLMSTGSSGFENVSPPIPPPGPVYQAGELSHFEKSFEDGNSEMETEEQGYQSPMQEYAGQSYTSQPRPAPSRGGGWGIYPYYDFMFLTGQYPPGTINHFSSSYEQGRDNWQDADYVRYYAPYNSGPAQQIETFDSHSSVPQSFEDPRQPAKSPAMAGYGQGGAQDGVPAASHGSFMQPGLYEAPTLSQAGGYNMAKVGY